MLTYNNTEENILFYLTYEFKSSNVDKENILSYLTYEFKSSNVDN